jgi:hypothetical protein
MELIDFTNCKTDLTGNYAGSDRKKAIIYNGNKYMIKFVNKIEENIGCQIFKSIGFDVQNTLLGTINKYTVVACQNFIPDNCKLIEFKFIEGALFEEKPSKIPSIEHIYAAMTKPNEYFSKEFGKIALERYWDTFIVDALLGNFNRHANNWGYLINQDTLKFSLAPIYDCGACLYPQTPDEALKYILTNPYEIKKRIDVFPKAALKIGSIEKISYKDLLYSCVYDDCNKSLLKIMPNINLMEIFDIVKNTPSISDIRKEFYITMINERYNQLLLEPYIHLMYNLEYNEINNMDKQIIKNSLQNKNELSFDKFLQIRAVER